MKPVTLSGKLKKQDRLDRMLPMILGGMSQRAIAQQLGISKTQVVRDQKTLSTELTERNRRSTEQYQSTAIERLNRLLNVWWQKATLGDPVMEVYEVGGRRVETQALDENGRPRFTGPVAPAFDRVMRVLREMHKIQGLHLENMINVQTNIVQDPRWIQFISAVMDALKDEPRALAKVRQAASRAEGIRNVGPANDTISQLPGNGGANGAQPNRDYEDGRHGAGSLANGGAQLPRR